MKTISLFVIHLFSIVLVNGQNELKQKLDQLAKDYENANFHGAIIVSKESDIITEAAFGLANQKTGEKNTLSTLFKTESTGKMFTAVAVLQLVEAGNLDLQKTIIDYWPESKIKNAHKMTLHQLLSHQSGLTSPWERPDFEFKEYTDKEWWNIIETNPLVFDEPGKGVYYSSSAFEVLAKIVEKVSGMEFQDYCKEKIFKPAEMENTYFTMDTTSYFARGANPYRWISSKTYYEYPITNLQAGGAGGWISCIEDFHHFALALMNEKLISKKYLDVMMTEHVDMPPGKYGYGMQIITDSMIHGKTVYGHNGGGMGFSCDLFFEPESKTIMVTMLNMYGNSRSLTLNYIATVLGNEPQRPEKDKREILFDLIAEKGLEDFDTNYPEYLKAIEMEEPDPFFLISFSDGYEMLQQIENKKKYLISLKKIIPENPVLYIFLGDIEKGEKHNELAMAYYLKARELSEKYELQWLGEIDIRLRSL